MGSGFTISVVSGPPMPRHIVVGNIPYEYAVPKLTGWNVGYTASDQHVKEIGIWIEEDDCRNASSSRKSSHLTGWYPSIADQAFGTLGMESDWIYRQGHLAGLRI